MMREVSSTTIYAMHTQVGKCWASPDSGSNYLVDLGSFRSTHVKTSYAGPNKKKEKSNKAQSTKIDSHAKMN